MALMEANSKASDETVQKVFPVCIWYMVDSPLLWALSNYGKYPKISIILIHTYFA